MCSDWHIDGPSDELDRNGCTLSSKVVISELLNKQGCLPGFLIQDTIS